MELRIPEDLSRYFRQEVQYSESDEICLKAILQALAIIRGWIINTIEVVVCQCGETPLH